jgi:aryl-alcohol dehydrogenase-like predicted oxidoreductase
MISRRQYLSACLAAGVSLALAPPRLLAEDAPLALARAAIPGSGETIPRVGLGSSASFAQLAGSAERGALGEVLQSFIAHGASVFDTAPSYGASEEVAGQLVQELGLAERFFWATKLNVAGRGGGAADPDAARAQLETSFRRIGKDPIDLVQVHNMGDPDTQLGLLREYKQAGRIRYLGITTTFANQYEHLERVIRSEPLDFIGIDYAIDNRTMEERILPLAQDKGIAVLVYAPFGRTRLWQKVREVPLPDWAAEFDAHSWAQFFLKFVLSHPAVTATTPATTRTRHLLDNLGAGVGRFPDAAMRQRMIDFVAAL